MATTRLTNERWGFSSNCFVCEPSNDRGLRLEFHHDDERDVVTCDLELTDAHSGAPTYVHGGVCMAVLDEIQSWATIAIGGKFAVTTRTEVTFGRPVRVGRAYRVEAEVLSSDGDVMETVGRILDHEGRTCAEGRSTFHVLSAAVAADAIGDVTGDDRSFLRDE